MVREPRIVLLRALFVTFIAGVIVIQWLAGLAIGDADPSWSSVVASAMLLAVTMVMAGGIVAVRVRYHEGRLGSTRVAAYSNRFFLQVAFGEVPAFATFFAALFGAPLWSCRVGGVIALVGFVFAAPTRRDVAKQDPDVIAALLTRPTR
jgi:hypothetical protein